MRFLTRADHQAFEPQRRLFELRQDLINAKRTGSATAIAEVLDDLASAARDLVAVRHLPIKLQCRHCGHEFSPDGGEQLAIGAIRIYRQGALLSETIYPHGEEVNLVYCSGCAKASTPITWAKSHPQATSANASRAEHEDEIEVLRDRLIVAAQTGERAQINELEQAIRGRLDSHAATADEGATSDCRHCNEIFDAGDRVELEVRAILIRRPHAIPEIEACDKPLYLTYCADCAKGSRLQRYLSAR